MLNGTWGYIYIALFHSINPSVLFTTHHTDGAAMGGNLSYSILHEDTLHADGKSPGLYSPSLETQAPLMVLSGTYVITEMFTLIIKKYYIKQLVSSLMNVKN